MKLLISLLLSATLAALACPAFAENVYDNGPVNGEVDAFTINFGFSVTDSFTVSNGNGNIGALDFYAWLLPGDTASSVEVQIGSTPFGSDLYDQVLSVSQANCFANVFGFNVCEESANFGGTQPQLANGTYWLTLQNAIVSNGDPVYWDENSGAGCQSQGCPSTAENETGSIPSEAFTLTAAGTTSTTTGTTPEPGSIVLFASGLLAGASMLRGKLF